MASLQDPPSVAFAAMHLEAEVPFDAQTGGPSDPYVEPVEDDAVMGQPRSTSRNRDARADFAPRPLSRGRTPVGQRKFRRFMNDNMVDVHAAAGGVSVELLIEILDHMYLKIEHKSIFRELMMHDRDLFRSFRRGELGSEVLLNRQADATARPSSERSSVRSVLQGMYLSVPCRSRPMLLKETRRSLQSPPGLVSGMEALLQHIVAASHPADAAAAAGGAAAGGPLPDGLAGGELREALTGPVTRSLTLPRWEVPLTSAYSRLLLHAVCGFYGLASSSGGGGGSVLVAEPSEAAAGRIIALQEGLRSVCLFPGQVPGPRTADIAPAAGHPMGAGGASGTDPAQQQQQSEGGPGPAGFVPLLGTFVRTLEEREAVR